MRVVGGIVGGRRLRVPPGGQPGSRPTSELVRGAVFNSLTSLGLVEDTTVWDLFAGSGALGIEALSRGAASVTFVEQDRRAVAVIRANLDDLGLADGAAVVAADVLGWLRPGGPAPDVVLVDPPYAFQRWDDLLASLRACGAGLVVCESDRPIEPADGWLVVRHRRHGGTVVTLLEPRGATTE